MKQKASATLDNFEGKSSTHKATSEAGSGDSSKPNPGNNGKGSSGSDADNPLAAVLGKLQGNDGGSSNPVGNMAKDIFEDLGAKNPEIPPDLVRNIPYSALTNPLPCPATNDQIDPAKLASGKFSSSPEPSSLTHGRCHWPTRRATTLSGRCLPHPLFLSRRASQAVTSL